MNPCPCGRGPAAGCRCTPHQVAAYESRISGPLLDRIDLHVEVAPLTWEALEGPAGEPSAAVARRVREARERQAARGGPANHALAGQELRAVAALDQEAQSLLRTAMTTYGLSARGHDRVLRVARTIADLGRETCVTARHVAEALTYRRCDRDTK
jgi:magnesium chelatase family protein